MARRLRRGRELLGSGDLPNVRSNELWARVFIARSAVCNRLEPVLLAAIGGLLVLVSAPAVLVGSGVAVVLAGLGDLTVNQDEGPVAA